MQVPTLINVSQLISAGFQAGNIYKYQDFFVLESNMSCIF